MPLQVSVKQLLIASTLLVNARELQIADDLHHDWVSLRKLRVLGTAARAHVISREPALYAVMAEQLVLALLAL